MHEFSLMESVIRIVKASARDNGVARVTSVALVVGRLSGVNVEALRFAFDVLRGEEPLIAGSTIEVAEHAGEGACPACGETSSIWDFDLRCPRCGFCPLEVTGGDGFYVRSITGERNDG